MAAAWSVCTAVYLTLLSGYSLITDALNGGGFNQRQCSFIRWFGKEVEEKWRGRRWQARSGRRFLRKPLGLFLVQAVVQKGRPKKKRRQHRTMAAMRTRGWSERKLHQRRHLSDFNSGFTRDPNRTLLHSMRKTQWWANEEVGAHEKAHEYERWPKASGLICTCYKYMGFF